MHKDRNIRHTSCCIQGCLTAIFYDQAMSMSNKYPQGPSAFNNYKSRKTSSLWTFVMSKLHRWDYRMKIPSLKLPACEF